MNWRKIRQGCGDVAFALMLVGFCVLFSLFYVSLSCVENHVVTGGVAIIAVVSAILAAVGGRCWVLVGSIGLFFLVPIFTCA